MKYLLLKSSFVLLLSTAYLYSSGQSLRMKKGQHIPALVFDQVFNHTNQTLRFNELKGKLVILDFWGFSCASCLEAFPKLDSIQSHFGDKIQIIPVCREKKEDVIKFFKSHKKVHLPALPFITGDTLLRRMFADINGGYAWIDKTGVFLFEADGYNLTMNTITSLLGSGKANIRESVKQVYMNTLFDERISNQVEYSSSIIRISSTSGIRPPGVPKGRKGIADVGSIMHLYQRAFQASGSEFQVFFRPGRTVLEVNDSTKFIRPSGLHGIDGVDWADKYVFGYQLVLPEDNKQNEYEIMKRDLNGYFQLQVSVQQRPVKSIVLVRTSKKDKLVSKGASEKDNLHSTYIKSTEFNKVRYIINKPFEIFSHRLNGIIGFRNGMPFIDSTGYSGNIDIELPGEVVDSSDFAFWKKALKKYDLDLVERWVVMDVLVVRDKIPDVALP